MSLPKLSRQTALFDVHNLLGRDFAPDNRYRLFAELILPRIVAARPLLEGCYCADNGRPGVEPVLLLGISLLQFTERLPDRQAIEMVRYHVGWKLALNLGLDLVAPDPSTLSNFRQRLVDHDQAKVAFDTVLGGLREAGLVPRRSPQRLDSTHVLGAVARLSALDCLRETMRLALMELAGVAGLKLPAFWESFWERYVENKLDYGMEEAALAAKYQEAGADMLALMTWGQQQEQAVKDGRQMQLLGRVLGEHFDVVEGVVHKRRRPGGSVQNPHDPDVEYSAKGKGKTWEGYKAQVAETVNEQPREEGEPTGSFLTAVETQEASGSEKAGMEQVARAQAESGLDQPSQLYVDSGYVSAEAMKEAKEAGSELVGPALGSSHQNPGFGTQDFDVDVENRRAVCPAGRINSGCSRMENAERGTVGYRFEWGGECQACSLVQLCVTSKSGSRTLEVGEHHGYLQERRREQKTEAFAQEMKKRNGIEGTISELVRGHGMRRARYRGLPKARLQNYLIGAACNAKRWVRRVAWAMSQGLQCAPGVAAAALGQPAAVAGMI